MHLASQATIDLVFKTLNEIPNRSCFVRELYYLGPEVRCFLGELNPEAEIGVATQNTLYSRWHEEFNMEAWSWTPVDGWKQRELADDALRHPWEHEVLEGVDDPSTLGGVDGEFI